MNKVIKGRDSIKAKWKAMDLRRQGGRYDQGALYETPK